MGTQEWEVQRVERGSWKKESDVRYDEGTSEDTVVGRERSREEGIRDSGTGEGTVVGTAGSDWR